MNKFDFLRVYLSPFKAPKLEWYFGKIAIGTPYFLPRKWIKNKEKPGWLKAVPRKFGFDIVSLGWKTKWEETDYRFEWSPGISFVAFNKQINVMFAAPHLDHYWECWLYYTRNTDKTKSTKERIAQARKEFPCVYINGDERICYWDLILKEKWL